MRAERLVAMDFNGKSDPYVGFYSYPRGLLRVRSKHGNLKNGHKGQKFPQTARKDMTLTPVWEDHEVPNLLLAQTSKEHVLHQSLVIALYDWDRMSQDDVDGASVHPHGRVGHGAGAGARRGRFDTARGVRGHSRI